MRVLQIAPEIAPGSGVGAVAYHLEAAWRRAGVKTGRFTLHHSRGDWLPGPGGGLRGRIALLARVVWFSTVGTWEARRIAAACPDAVIVCHNDALAGDVYVNHGILRVAMAARGRYLWRMMRNPLHLFTSIRDSVRYRGGTHRTVVSLTAAERVALLRTYPRMSARTVVIPNGVDTDRFRPPTQVERVHARSTIGVPEGVTNILFIGHEFDRKGLGLVLEAAVSLTDVHVSVVGGTSEMLVGVRHQVSRLGLEDRVHLAGQADPLAWLHAADALALPSAYEANALVVLEAMASGLPVVVTPVGYAPELVTDGVTGYLVERNAASVRAGLAAVADATPAQRTALARAARTRAEEHSWDRIAARYLDLFHELQGQRGRETSG